MPRRGGYYETFAKLHGEAADRYSVITSGMFGGADPALTCCQLQRSGEEFFVDCVDIDFLLTAATQRNADSTRSFALVTALHW